MAKGTAKETLTTILTYADNLIAANVTQEGYKAYRKTLTIAAVKEFNDFYDQMVSICKIAGKFYKDDIELKNQFSFRNVSKTLNAVKAPKPQKAA